MTNILSADSFTNDWYGWLTNQVSHIALGILFAIIISMGSFLIIGELPHRHDVMYLTAFVYAAFEVVGQGWRGFDTLEDFAFVVLYGAGGGLASSAEIIPGEPLIVLDLMTMLSFIIVACCHLLFGVVFRLLKG